MKINFVIVLFCHVVNAYHFRGGTISWKPTGIGNEVEFSFRLGWAYGVSPGCTAAKIGQYVTRHQRYHLWVCTNCGYGNGVIANTSYICTGASQSENWQQGESTFTHTFPGFGPYTIRYTGVAWMHLDYGRSGGWSISTVVYLAIRNDTNQSNSSPITTGKPTYIVQYGCLNEIRIPVFDDDGDDVRCRWASGSECKAVCEALPYASIDYETCVIRFIAKHTVNGTFAVAVTIEDFPKSNISIGGILHPTTSPLSAIPLQFIVKTPIVHGVSCNDEPRFVSPTDAEGTIIRTDIFQLVNISFFASGTRRIANIDLTVPAGMEYSTLQSYSSNTSFVHSTWIPLQNQVGSHIICALADDSLGKRSQSRCITIVVKDVSPCSHSPCEHEGTCVRQGITQNYVCYCGLGFSGNLCETDIDECASSPCQNQGTCNDHVNQYNCTCMAGYSGYQCQTEIDECSPHPCQHNGTCTDGINMYTCACPLGLTGLNCESDIDECVSSPCINSGTCNDLVNGFICSCIAGFTGDQCQTEIDECASHPCENNGTCSDGVNMFTCQCPQNFTGMMCESDIGPCDSSPCKHESVCVRQGTTQNYTCYCVPGYTGSLCETDINECADQPCSLLFECVDYINGVSCKLVVWKLIVIGLAVLMLLGGCTVLLCFLKKKRHKTKNGIHPEHEE